MKRLFDEHKKRKTMSLDGAWKFLIDPHGVGDEKEYKNGLPEGETVIVPSVWNTESGLLDYEGIAWYEKKFYTEGGCLRFHFGAVMTECFVYLDGILLGSHYGGFCEFDFISSEIGSGEHSLVVKVDNRFDEHSIPQKVVDWYHYGGIIRSVTVEKLEGVCVLGHRFRYELSDDLKTAECTPTVVLFNANPCETEAKVTLNLDGEKNAGETVAIPGSEYMTIQLSTFTISNIRLWDEGRGELYTVEYTTETDDLCDRVGFRKIEVKDGKLLLNNRAVEIMGVNRHHDHPDFGMAFPPARMKHDIDLICDMGCNSIRGSHYPNSRDFVDMLDERGILFWSEIPIWGGGFSQAALGDEKVVKRGLEMHREMVSNYYNHPSIIIWGLHNEIKSATEEAYAMSKTYYEYVKAVGGNRAVVYASDRPLTDICLEFCDIICINQYCGWYTGGLDAWEPFLEKFCERRKALGFEDKPIIMSEFGAGAIYGFHDAELPIWSEEYQAKLLDFCLNLFHEHPAVIGSFIWQFCDIRTAKEMGMSRARGFNNKGILNEHRRPKSAYYAVQKCYKSFKNEK